MKSYRLRMQGVANQMVPFCPAKLGRLAVRSDGSVGDNETLVVRFNNEARAMPPLAAIDPASFRRVD